MAMKDYMTNSPFGQVAGALLAKKDDDYKKNMAIAFGAGFLKDFLSNLTAFQQEERLDARDRLKTESDIIFSKDSSEWADFADERARVDEYNRMGESAYLNKYASQNMTYSDDAIARGITWENRMQLPKDVRDSLQDEFNSQRDRGKQEIEILRQDPRVKFRTVQGYTEAGRRAFLAKDELAKNDPTKRGVIREEWNNLFKFDKDGNYTGNNAEKIRMDRAIELAVEDYDNQQLSVQAATRRLEDFYSGSIGGDAGDLEFDSINMSQKPYDAETIRQQKKVNKDILEERNSSGRYTGRVNKAFFDIPLEIPIVRKDKIGEDGNPVKETVNIKEGNFQNIKVLDANGQVSVLSTEMLYDALAVHQLRQNEMLIKNGSNALVGAQSIHSIFNQWANEGRFQRLKDVRKGEGFFDGPEQITWNGEDILLVLPSTNGNNLIENKVQLSDAVATHQTQGEDKTPEVSDDGIPAFDANKMNLYAQDGMDTKWSSLSSVEKEREINAYINLYPEHEEQIRQILTNKNLPDNSEVPEEKQTTERKQFSELNEEEMNALLERTDDKARKEMRQGVKSLLGMQPEQILNRRIKQVNRAIENINAGRMGSVNSTEFRKWMKDTKDIKSSDFYKLDKQERLPLFEEYLDVLNKQLSMVDNQN
tara:strand:+ start:3108 stop:5057 length:1950 start_codon:yes stop_codon:yes gene_type:complete